MVAHVRIRPPNAEPFLEAIEESRVIGRSSAADCVVADPLLSRRHARVYVVEGALWVEDLGSRNGTFRNGRKLETAEPFGPNDAITLGGTTVELARSGQPRVTVTGGNEALSSSGTILRRAEELLGSAAPQAESVVLLKRHAERLRIVNDVHQALGQALSVDELVELILDRAVEELRPEQAAVFLRTPDGELEPAATRAIVGSAEDIVISRSLVTEVVDKHMAALVLDARTDDRFAASESILMSGIRSIAAAPLFDAEGSLGMIALFSRAGTRSFREDDLELLVPLASVAALKIRNSALRQEAEARRRLEQELALARRIQLALLPDHLPTLPGFSLWATNVPSRGVSGDYYDVRLRGEGTEAVLVVADVSGKGIGAALLTATLEALSEGPVEDGLEPDEICLRLGRGIFRRTPPEKYATAVFAACELANGRLRWTNAGHVPGLVVRKDGAIERLGSTGPPLGLLEEATYDERETVLGPGDAVVFFTDGITEAENPAGDEFGVARLEAALAGSAGHSPATIGRAIEETVGAFVAGGSFLDDRTILVLQREA